ncbi:tetratricopeptide repeat protein [Candidatus Omnitrophota bacterium]
MLCLCCSAAFSYTFDIDAREYREKGYAAQQSGNIEEAISYYKTSIVFDPKQVSVYNDLGIAYEIQGAFDMAEKSYLKAMDVDKTHMPAYSNLAFLYEKMQRYSKAVDYWRIRIALANPGDPWIEKADESIRRMAELSPDLRKQLLQEEMHKLKNAVVDYKLEQIRKLKELTDNHVKKGKDYLGQGKYSLAKKEFYAALLLTPGDSMIIDLYNSVLELEKGKGGN